MWHEARKQERKIRGMLVDYRKRAERRQDFYEKIKADPTQFMQIHSRKCKIHLDPAIAAAGDSPAIMMPWQGQQDNMIDRFDGRAYLDLDKIPKPPNLKDPNVVDEPSPDERHCNYERYRILAQNDFLGISEEKYLHQLYLEEQFGINAQLEQMEKPKKKTGGAAIGYTYEDSNNDTNMPFCQTPLIPPINTGSGGGGGGSNNGGGGVANVGGGGFSTTTGAPNDDDSDSDLDVDVAINISKIDTAQAHELNACGRHYGMKSNDFYSFLTKDADEADALKLAREEEQEKIMLSGRKSRRERRAQRERRFAGRPISPPSYAAKEEGPMHENEDDEKNETGESRSPSPENSGKITYITSFGGDDELQPHSKISINFNKSQKNMPPTGGAGAGGNAPPYASSYGFSGNPQSYADKVKENLEKLKNANSASTGISPMTNEQNVRKPMAYQRNSRRSLYSSRSRSRSNGRSNNNNNNNRSTFDHRRQNRGGTGGRGGGGGGGGGGRLDSSSNRYRSRSRSYHRRQQTDRHQQNRNRSSRSLSGGGRHHRRRTITRSRSSPRSRSRSSTRNKNIDRKRQYSSSSSSSSSTSSSTSSDSSASERRRRKRHASSHSSSSTTSTSRSSVHRRRRRHHRRSSHSSSDKSTKSKSFIKKISHSPINLLNEKLIVPSITTTTTTTPITLTSDNVSSTTNDNKSDIKGVIQESEKTFSLPTQTPTPITAIITTKPATIEPINAIKLEEPIVPIKRYYGRKRDDQSSSSDDDDDFEEETSNTIENNFKQSTSATTTSNTNNGGGVCGDTYHLQLASIKTEKDLIMQQSTSILGPFGSGDFGNNGDGGLSFPNSFKFTDNNATTTTASTTTINTSSSFCTPSIDTKVNLSSYMSSSLNNKQQSSTTTTTGSFNPRDRLKRKMQILLNKQYKADKLAEIEKTERQVQQQQEREDEMRELALRLRRRQRELRHKYGTPTSSHSDEDSENGGGGGGGGGGVGNLGTNIRGGGGNESRRDINSVDRDNIIVNKTTNNRNTTETNRSSRYNHQQQRSSRSRSRSKIISAPQKLHRDRSRDRTIDNNSSNSRHNNDRSKNSSRYVITAEPRPSTLTSSSSSSRRRSRSRSRSRGRGGGGGSGSGRGNGNDRYNTLNNDHRNRRNRYDRNNSRDRDYRSRSRSRTRRSNSRKRTGTDSGATGGGGGGGGGGGSNNDQSRRGSAARSSRKLVDY